MLLDSSMLRGKTSNTWRYVGSSSRWAMLECALVTEDGKRRDPRDIEVLVEESKGSRVAGGQQMLRRSWTRSLVCRCELRYTLAQLSTYSYTTVQRSVHHIYMQYRQTLLHQVEQIVLLANDGILILLLSRSPMNCVAPVKLIFLICCVIT